jgi:hypothetical protein
MLTKALTDQLDEKNVSLGRFREITARLFSYGVIVRDEDSTEARFYDDSRRIEGALTEYLGIAGLRLVHDVKNEFFRLYPPGAAVPGLPEDDAEPVFALRARLSTDFVAAVLALRFQYQQGLTEGGSRLTDKGEVLIRFEELAVTLQTQLKRTLPETTTEKMKLLAELRRHRVLHYSNNFTIADEDALMAIRPTILGIVSEDAMQAALEIDTPVAETDTADELVEEPLAATDAQEDVA